MTITAISADSHVTEPGDCYVPHIDPAYRDRAPVAITHERLGAVMSIVLAEYTGHLDDEVRDDIVFRNTARLYGLALAGDAA